ncbi:MAG: YgeY family selenium metabolism-linked hydrolase, partial [Mogibacterium sp.]|nr:YgeY family selenium metabolism-linked hydrolase [Mogibacterium sp.]
MIPDYEAIKKAAENYGPEISRVLRDMISHPSESAEEKEVAECIKAEMEKLGYDKAEFDGLGNVIGWMGDGDKIIA